MVSALINAVTEEHTGVTLSADAAPGATTLNVYDAYDLPDGPGVIHFDGNLGTFTGDPLLGQGGEEPIYLSVDRDNGILNLDPVNSPLAWQHYQGEWADYRPLTMTRYAWCRVNADEDEALVARVPASMDKALATGDYASPIPCQLRRDGDEWVLADLPGLQPGLAADDITVTGSLLIVDDTGEVKATIDETGGYFDYL